MNPNTDDRTDRFEEQARKRTGRIQKASQELRAYCMMWGNKGDRDLHGEYFTPDTNVGNLNQRIPIRMNINGDLLDIGSATLDKDDLGIYATGKLEPITDSQIQYAEAIMSLVERNSLSFSTSSNLEEIRQRNENYVDENGEIRYWPIVAVVVTPTPADPR